MDREELLEIRIGEIQETLEEIPGDTPEEEVSWLRQELDKLAVELKSLYFSRGLS